MIRFTPDGETARLAMLRSLGGKITETIRTYEAAIALIEDPRASDIERTIAQQEIDRSNEVLSVLETRRSRLIKLGSAP